MRRLAGLNLSEREASGTMALVRVPPDPKYTAEVLVLFTSLQAKRCEYNAGKRCLDLLEIKRAHFKPIDFNRDTRMAGDDSGKAENMAVQKLFKQNKLKLSEEGDLILPQIFIDGNPVGSFEDLQILEDDDKLTDILLRKDKEWKGEEILPEMMTIEAKIRAIAQAEGDFSDDEEEEELELHEGEYSETDESGESRGEQEDARPQPLFGVQRPE